MTHSSDPFVHQFVHAEPDGPVAFHYAAEPLVAHFEMDGALSSARVGGVRPERRGRKDVALDVVQ